MFTGDERDAETGLDHTWVSGFVLANPEQEMFRQYSNAQARWLTPDPAGLAAVDPSNPQSWNRYAYVENDPVDWLDPSGLGPQGPPRYECSTSDPFNMGCNPPQFGGGGSGSCSLDGIDTPCGIVISLGAGATTSSLGAGAGFSGTFQVWTPDDCVQANDEGNAGLVTPNTGNSSCSSGYWTTANLRAGGAEMRGGIPCT